MAPERFALQVRIGEATQRKPLRGQALLRHQMPPGDLAEVLDRALDALLERVEGRKLGKTKAPRKARTSEVKRYVPRAVRRQVVAWDGVRCAFVAEDGRRCEETGFLELDHVVPVSRGGEASAAASGCSAGRTVSTRRSGSSGARRFGQAGRRGRRTTISSPRSGAWG